MAVVKDSNGDIIYDDESLDHELADAPDIIMSRKVKSFEVESNGWLTIILEPPVETVNLNTDVEYIQRSEKRMYDWLNYQGTIESSDNQKQKLLKFLQSLDDEDRALVKVLGMICICDKKLLDGGNKDV